MGRKSFIPGFEEFRRLRKELNDRFWDNWRLLKEIRKNCEEQGTEMPPSERHLYSVYRDKMSRYFKLKGDIERKSLNYPIQGSSANITKQSAIYFFTWIKENRLQNIVLFCNQVHDENVVECPLEIQDKTARALDDCMKRAGELYCKRVPLKAEAEASLFWKK